MVRQILKSAWVAVFSVMLLPAAAQAKITIEDFQGSLLVTSPDGKVTMIDEGDTPGDIPPGSTLELFNGHVTIHSEAGEEYSVSCLGTSASGAGASMNLSCGEDSGVLKVQSGVVSVRGNEEKQLSEGQQYEFSAAEKTAPPTGQDENSDLPTVEDDLPPPDSRSIEASPSQ